ncbi:MAG: hypothetical protein AB1634_18600 [Thermodesulfobacteriota bacterium]
MNEESRENRKPLLAEETRETAVKEGCGCGCLPPPVALIRQPCHCGCMPERKAGDRD